MGQGSRVFFQEVEDAIKKNPPDVGELIVLRDLCREVDAGNKLAASELARALTRLLGVEDPLFSISEKLYHALMARVLLRGWFDEFDLLMHWDRRHHSSQDEEKVTGWAGILEIVREPGPIGLSSMFIPNVFLLLDREAQWQRALNGLEGAFRHLAEVNIPMNELPPPSESTGYIPGREYDTGEWALPSKLADAVEHFFRLLQMIFQQTLELAVKQLKDGDAHFTRRLQVMQGSLGVVLNAQAELYRVGALSPGTALRQFYKNNRDAYGRLRRGLYKEIRVAEFRYGSVNKHRFLDAFPLHQSRSVVFHSLDRENKERPDIRGERLGNIYLLRNRQIGFYLTVYGHPANPGEAPNESHKRRNTLIKSKHRGGLDLTKNDDLVAFLSNVFADELAELTRAVGSRKALPRDAASLQAWTTTVELWGTCFSHLTSHSRLNLTEGPPNYLTHAFPRNLGGRLFHDCGVYAVRSAYVLLSVLERINRLHGDAAGAVHARWVLLPLHVGVLIEIGKFGLLVQHNDHLFALDGKLLESTRKKWLEDRIIDPSEPDEEPPLKLHEDIAASAFGSDLDMPIRSVPLLDPGQPVTIQTIWTSYQLKVVPAKLFTGIVGDRNAKQYQFDNRYLRLSELEREWYNEAVLNFWNRECNQIWEKRKDGLKSPTTNNNAKLLEDTKKAYEGALLTEIFALITNYSDRILPEKRKLTKDLRENSKLLLMPGIRIVQSMRLKTDLAVVQNVKKHIEDVMDPQFKFKADFVPPFAKPEERLIEVP